MQLTRSLRIIILSAVLVTGTEILTYAEAPQERLPKLEIDESQNSKRILDNYFDQISTRWSQGFDNETLRLLDDMVEKLNDEFDSKLRRSKLRFTELKCLLASQPKLAPYFTAFYFRQIIDLRNSCRQINDTLTTYQLRIDCDVAQIENHLNMVRQFDIACPELRWRKNWIIKNVSPKLTAYKRWLEQLNRMLAENKEFEDKLNNYVHIAEREIRQNHDKYWSYHFDFFGHIQGTSYLYQWRLLKQQFHDWRLTLPLTLEVILPAGTYYQSILYHFLTCLVAALILFLVILRIRWLKIESCLLAYFMAWAGLFFVLEVIMLPSTNDMVIFTLAGLCLGWALLDAAWKFRKKITAAVGPDPFLSFILAISLIDILISLLVPVKVLLTIIVFMAAIQIIWLTVILCLYKYPTAEKILVGGPVCLSWIVAGCIAWSGYLYPAMLCVVITGMGVCVFYAGSVFTNAIVERLGKNTERRLLASFIFTLMIPFLWLALIIGGIRWIGQVFNAGRILQDLYAQKHVMPALMIQISFREILFLILLGLFLKFVLNWLRHLLMVFGGSRNLESGSLTSFFLVVQYLAWLIFIGYVLNSFDIRWENIKLILGGLSVGFGFALKEIIENFVCGLILLIGKEVRPGDVVEFDGTRGIVEKINIRATFIKTFANAIITLPNNQVVSKDFKNWTLNGHIMRCELNVGVAYGSDITKVVESIKEALNLCNLVLKVKDPEVLFMDFGDSSLMFQVRFWIHVDNVFTAPSQVRHAIDNIFRANDIVIAFPQLDVHINSPESVSNITERKATT
ncbi:MAG: mechanosensitive ion channel [Victivallales bacterium]|nr:mechanosensitive ion channel [Victivallales bacterium]